MLTREEAAQELIDWHYTIDPRMTQAIRLLSANEDDPREPLKFLEVSPDTIASGNVMTFTFGPAGDIPYNMRIATITPEEMEQVRRGEMSMPEGWSLENSVEYPVPLRGGRGIRRWRRSKGIARSLSVLYSQSKPHPSSLMRSENG